VGGFGFPEIHRKYISSPHSLGLELTGYLIPVAPQAFVDAASIIIQASALAFGVLPGIVTFYRSPRNSLALYMILVRW